jgi:hypothetical protein
LRLVALSLGPLPRLGFFTLTPLALLGCEALLSLSPLPRLGFFTLTPLTFLSRKALLLLSALLACEPL